MLLKTDNFFHLMGTAFARNRRKSLLIALLTLTLFTYLFLKTPYVSSIQFFLFSLDSIACYRITNLETLPDISLGKPRKGKSIFFHETSCRSHTEGKIVLTPRQACSVESAARSNPNFDVFVLFTSPGTLIYNGTESDRVIKAVQSYPNVKFHYINYANYTKGTPVEQLYQSGKIESSYFAFSHASDVLRYLTLWKYGGIYLDLDVIVMKTLEDLPNNYAGAESDRIVAVGVMNFAPNGIGHHHAKSCLLDLKEHFRGNDWNYNGPGVITRLLQGICGVEKTKDMFKRDCQGFTVYPFEYFYPIPWWNWTMYFDEKHTADVLSTVKNSYAVHVWNKHSHDSKIPVDKNIAYAILAKKYCPKVFSECNGYF